ncbi:MAG: MBOAT family protein [Lachnospiraceae bacterium]|nr:MBOAT family protein [Lachnospiraceae bacterium]
MVFSSLVFTFLFLPLVLVLHFAVRNIVYRNVLLLIASIGFYAYGEPDFVFVMLLSVAVNYLAALIIDRFRGGRIARLCMALDVCTNLLILYLFKYLDFSIDIMNRLFHADLPAAGMVLPIGISFYTFQALSYVIDVYRGKVCVQKNPLYIALYISFFPQLIAGPIVRYTDIEKQIMNRTCSMELFSEGAVRFMLGFCKKILLANNLSMVVLKAFSEDVTQTNPLFLWLGSICFSLQIYFDFSGYSDMAIGLGKLFGFRFGENFNYPYISGSVTEFWRRWHISLGQWFRDYVYIPLGGSRVRLPRHIMNILIVWLLTGIWHGANYTFIVWGLGFFVMLVIEKMIVKPSERKNKAFLVFWRGATLLCINFGWVIFNSPTIGEGVRYCLAMIGWFGNGPEIDGNILFCIREYRFFIVAGLLCSVPVSKKIKEKVDGTRWANIATVIEALGYALFFMWAVSFLLVGAHNPFIYFNF